MDVDGPGVLRHLWMTQPFPELLRHLILRIYWDDQPHPSVECPMGDFFCCSWNQQREILAQPINVNPRGGLNCFFPMPFKKHVRITIENDSDVDIKEFFWNFDYTLEPVGGDALYFHAQFRRTPKLAKATEYVVVDNIRGQGQYVGAFFSWGYSQGSCNEGEIKMYLDGDGSFPTICGTGAEDYFLAAWGFGDDYSAPFGGFRMASGVYGNTGARALMYRFHVPDPICFKRDFRMTIQALTFEDLKNIPYEDRLYKTPEDDIASVAYWYQTLPSEVFPQLPSREVRLIA